MIRFLDGPAQGVTLFLRRAPLLLRVVRSPTGEVDALDQLDDVPAPEEEVWAYRRVGAAGRTHIDYATRRKQGLYSTDESPEATAALRDEVLAWCQEWGGSPDARIVVCGLAGDGYEVLGWEEIPWVSAGPKSPAGRINASRERIWFSPGCLRPTLF